MMRGGWGRPMGVKLSHVLIFVLALGWTKMRGMPRSLGRGVWEGRWLASYCLLGYGMELCGLEGWRVRWLMEWLFSLLAACRAG